MTAGAEARELSPALRDATADQPAARLALAGALAAGPVHAYLFAGPGGQRQARRRAGLRRRDPGDRRARPRRRAPPRARRPLAAP